MQISAVRVFLVQGLVIVRVETDAGVSGYGECSAMIAVRPLLASRTTWTSSWSSKSASVQKAVMPARPQNH